MMLIRCSFTSTPRSLFSISCKTSLRVMNSQFCLFRKVFISFLNKQIKEASFLKESFTRCIILSWQLFYFNLLSSWQLFYFNLSSHYLLAWKVFTEKTGSNVDFFVYNFFFFLLLLLKFFVCLWLLTFNYNVSQDSPIQVQPTWGPLGLMDLNVHFSFHIWKIFSHIALNMLFVFSLSFPSEIPIKQICFPFIMFHNPCRFSSFFFFSFLWLGTFQCSILQVPYSFLYKPTFFF